MGFNRFPCPFGKYLLLDRINSGGMAEVYRAKLTGAEKFQRQLAIKCMLPELIEDREFTTMFVDEAKMAAQLAHAGIVQIYELGRLDQQLYIAMELVNGRDLRDLIRRANATKKPLPVGFVAYVIHKTAEALDFAHHKKDVDGKPLNLVHRDVSPQNILVSYDGEVKVVDFGIAKAEARETKTRAGVIKGKFSYLAPEQVVSGVVDHRADIFALGAVLFEALTGQKLFNGGDDISTLDRVRAAYVPPLINSRADIPAELEPVLRRALAADANDRYATASEFAEALTPFLIEQQSLYGARSARAFMHGLYANEIAALAEQMAKDANVTLADCRSSGVRWAACAKTQIFQSAVDERPASAFAPATVIDQVQPPELATRAMQRPTPRPAPQPMAQMPSVTVPAEPPAPRRVAAQTALSARTVVNALLAATLVVLAIVVVVLLRSPGGAPIGDELFSDLQKSLALALPQDAHAAAGAPRTVSDPHRLAPATAVAAPQAPLPSNHAAPGVATPPPPAAPVPSPAPSPTPSRAAPPPVDDVFDDDSEDEDADDLADTSAARQARHRHGKQKEGFLNVKVPGAKAARLFIDGDVVGYAPLALHRLSVGKHQLRVVEEENGQAAREKTITLRLLSRHQRPNPLTVVVTF